jgi:hypothetical protein
MNGCFRRLSIYVRFCVVPSYFAESLHPSVEFASEFELLSEIHLTYVLIFQYLGRRA